MMSLLFMTDPVFTTHGQSAIANQKSPVMKGGKGIKSMA